MFSTPGSASVSSGRVGPHIVGAVEVSTTGTRRTRAARANATILWRTSSGGALALGHPFQSVRFVHVVALWGLVTGVLEILAAGRLALGTAARSCLAAGGAWSIFLAVFLLDLRHAFTEPLLIATGVYALVFGVLVAVAAFRLQRAAVPILMRAVDGTWTTR